MFDEFQKYVKFDISKIRLEVYTVSIFLDGKIKIDDDNLVIQGIDFKALKKYRLKILEWSGDIYFEN
jgi:hypothetical protein